jgi:hypothetical protein
LFDNQNFADFFNKNRKEQTEGEINMKELKIDGIILIPDDMSLQEFAEKFNDISFYLVHPTF